jgi:flagellar basal-body rod protein FlgC
MSDIVAISLSGLRASMASFGAAASNIANMNDAGPVPATGPNEPVPQNGSAVYQPIAAVPHSTGANGVATTIAPQLPSYNTAYDPSSPHANAKGEVAFPNVNLAEEMVKIAMAVQAFRANIAVMKAADQMTKSALDILS